MEQIKSEEKLNNNYKAAFIDAYEHIERISNYLNEMIGFKPIGSATFRRLKFLAETKDQVDSETYNLYKTIYNVISPMEAQITNFANEHLFFLELPENERVKNISTVNTSLLPAIEQLKQVLKTYVPNKLLNEGAKPKLKKPIVVKPAIKKQAVFNLKPTDTLTKPVNSTFKKLKQASVLYGEIMVKPGFAKKNPLIDSMKRYKETALLKTIENEKIEKRAQALIDELLSYSETKETIVDSIKVYRQTIRRAAAIKGKVTRQKNLSLEASEFAKNNNVAILNNSPKK